MNTKTLYIVKHIALVTLFAMGLVLVPAFNSSGTVLAQKNVGREIATQDMLSRALDFRSATDLTVYAENGVTDKGSSSIRGNVLSATGGNAQDAKTQESRRDLSNAFSAINQLPCTNVSDSNLSGKTFAPGVYCLSSAELAGQMVLDGGNSTGSIFVFRIAGSLNTKSGSSVSLINNAQSSNVFFAADDSASIGEGTNFRGNVLARNTVKADGGAVIEGRVMSVKGDVQLNDSVLAPAAPGFIEICKALDETGGAGLANRIFQFRIGALITEVPAGQCSGPISIEAGPIVIEELLTGRTANPNTGTFNGNFQLIDVRQLTNLGQPNTTALVSANLPLRTANVNVVAGDISAQTRLQFTNRFAIIGVVEICKEGIDSGVTGFFNFTINGLTSTAAPGTTGPLVGGVLTTPAPLVNFSVPVGQCSGPIAVTVPTAVGSGPPRTGQATINELPRTGFLFTSATTALGTAGGNGGTPATDNTNRLINFNVFGNGGGNATVLVVAGNDGGNGTNISGAGGATSVQTTVFFNNRTAPGQLKVCKIAGPGVAQLTPFTFTVGGVVPFAPVAVDTPVAVTNGSVLGTSGTVLTSGLATTQNPTLGTLRVAPAPAAVPQGGTFQTFGVTVLAGPASNPGGFCQIVPSTFVVDTAAFVNETGSTATIVDANGNSTGVTGQVRISRLASSTGILSVINNNTLTTAQTNQLTGTGSSNSFPIANPISGTGTVQPGVQSFPLTGGQNTGNVTGLIVPIRRGVTEVEFVNVAFSPVPLKICKVAGTGVTVGTPFTFTVTQDTAGGLLAPFSSTVTVLAGPAAVNAGDQNGTCDFVSGPFTNPTTNALGSFNFNSTVTVTETGGITGTVVAPNGITSPTGGVIANIAGRSALISNMVNGVNEVQFVNQAATGGTTPPKPVKKRTRFF